MQSKSWKSMQILKRLGHHARQILAQPREFRENPASLKNLAIRLCTSWQNPDEPPKVHENPVSGNCTLASTRWISWTRETTTTKCKDVYPMRERQSLDSSRIIVKSTVVTPLPGEISYMSKIMKPQLKTILAEYWHVMALHNYTPLGR